jgi:hypothetical protein
VLRNGAQNNTPTSGPSSKPAADSRSLEGDALGEALLASHADEVAQGGGEDGVARVDDVLRIA